MKVAVQRSAQLRTVLLVTPDSSLKETLVMQLTELRWTVLTAASGAEAFTRLNVAVPEAIIVDDWLPDLQVADVVEHVVLLCPTTDVLYLDGRGGNEGVRSTRRNELLYVLRSLSDNTVAKRPSASDTSVVAREVVRLQASANSEVSLEQPHVGVGRPEASLLSVVSEGSPIDMHLPNVVGGSAAMQELGRMVRLVAPHSATVLILGETGTGKELVAKAVHQLSLRNGKPFMVLNCAAIPEQLLEAELFGHTRGAFTGATTSRVGRIEAAHGGTLFLDEIGEMPMALQAKMLRFLESGEVQRVGDNEVARVDVRIVAATHQPLLANTDDKRFRLDLYHRLAVFPVEVPPLRERLDDLPMLVEHFLRTFAVDLPRKSISQAALERLLDYRWEGNVRELGHVVQRAIIMAGSAPVIAPEHLRMRERTRG